MWRLAGAVLVAALLVASMALVFAGCGEADKAADGAPGGETTLSTVADMSATTVVTGLERPDTVVTSPQSADKTGDRPEGAEPSTGVSGGGSQVVGGKSAQEYEAAIPDLKKKTEADPENLDTLQELAIAYYQTQKFEEAAATYQAMLGIRDDSMTRNNYANVLRDWGKTPEAKAEYEKAIAASPALTVAYINLASVWAREGSTDEAVKVLDRGIGKTTGEDKTRLESYKAQLTEKKEE